MEENNLNVAPTEQELIDAGFEDSHFGLMEFNLGDNTTIVADTLNDTFRFIGSSTWIELTKQKINDAFALFNQPLPQWEKPKPKVGEVWKNKLHRFHIIEGLNGTIWALILEGKDKSKVFDLSMVKYNHTKLADSLEEYYKEKFNKFVLSELDKQVEELDNRLKQQDSQLETAHEYSYKGLKAKGKIPHDRSGEDHDSIQAFKKLLAICEALNGMFINCEDWFYCPYWDKEKKELLGISVRNTATTILESPIYFTSKEAFESFRSAPKNLELFKTFLKITNEK